MDLGILIAVFVSGIGAGYAWRGAQPEPAATPSRSANTRAAVEKPLTPPAAVSSSAANSPGASNPYISRMAEVMLIGADFRREREFFKLLDDLKPGDAIAVRKLLARTLDQGVLYESLWDAFWTRWGEIDGAGAMEYILTTQDHSAVPKDIRRVMRGWGATDPVAAAEWTESHQDKHIRDELVGLTDGFASMDLAGATAMALQAAPPGDANLGSLMETLSEQAVRQGRVTGLKAWFDQLPEGDTNGARGKAIGHVYWRLYSADLDTAKDWVREQASKPWRSDKIVGEMAGKIADKDPKAAAEWLESVPPSPQSGVYPGLDTVLGHLISKDRAAAEKWLNDLADGQFKTQAAAAFTKATTPESVTVRIVTPSKE
jgi:hypothetical protein